MAYGKLNTDGTVQSANKQHDGFISFNQFQKDENGKFYPFYLKEKNAQGMYEPNKEKIEALKQEKVYEKNQENKKKKLHDLTVNLNNVNYDTNLEGLTNLGVVLTGMSFKLLQKMAQQSPENQALYDEVFDETISWKGADNKMHNVKIESLAKVLQKALDNKSQILMDSVK